MGQAMEWTTVFVPDDGRTMVRHGEQTFSFSGYPTLERWEARAEHLKRRILVSAGLWPMPEKAALNPKVTSRVEGPDYSIENVYFESWPGFFVTGNLYRPKGKDGPFPGIACPHGHWEHGRLQDGERGSVPARCISFARQGYIAFAYDMIGYNDSGLQMPYEGDRHPHRAFFYTPREFLWGISLMGLQLWNGIRVVDYLTSLPDVDPQRIGCTGASGGGTQTFMLMAVDSRVKVAAPVNMISAHYQGGCVCENMPNLRLDCYNVEFGALMAPRPLLMVSASGDWTSNTPQVEYPAVHSVYRLYGADDRVRARQVEAPHNYNQESREEVYAWFGKWLLDCEDPAVLKERPYELRPVEEMRVFGDKELPTHALMPGQLTERLIERAKTQISQLQPRDITTLQAYRELMGTAYRYALNAHQPTVGELRIERVRADQRDGYQVERLIIGQKKVGERIPALLFVPENPRGSALVVHPQGKSALIQGEEPGSLVKRLLDRGLSVLAIDIFGTGELRPVVRDHSVDHFHTFNRSDAALRVQDVLNGLAYLLAHTHTVHLIGIGEAGLWCLLARGLTSGVAQTVIDAAQFPCDDDAAWVERLFVPQLRRAGDLITAAALIAPGTLWVHNASPSFPTDECGQLYRIAGAPGALQIQGDEADAQMIVEALDAR